MRFGKEVHFCGMFIYIVSNNKRKLLDVQGDIFKKNLDAATRMSFSGS